MILAQNSTYDDHIIAEYEEYTAPPQVCYQFKKDDFNNTSKIADDLIFNITSKEYIGFKFSSSRNTFSSNYTKYFECVEHKSDHYECTRWDSIEKMRYFMKDDTMYLHIDYLQTPMEDDSLIYHIKSKSNNFAKGSLSPCYLSMDPIIAVENIKKESPKNRLLRSINIKDVVIYDLDFYKDLVIAVGEDNAPRTRELQSQDEYYESVILRSINGGKTWERVGPGLSIPHDNVIVLDDKQIIIASSIEGAGGEILTSSDGGNSWKTTYSGGMIETLNQKGSEIILTDITGNVFKSKDSGMSWQETPSAQHMETQEEEETYIEQKSIDSQRPFFLRPPEYRVDYETNTLIVQHRKDNCNALSLSLIYNQSNLREGILGPFWTLGGIESQITLKNNNELLFFNSYRGKKKHYQKGKDKQKFFYHKGSSKIEETKDGYTIRCDRSTHYFNKKGYLKKIVYEERSYTLYYENNRLHQIMEDTQGQQKPYLTFSYPYEGISITFHDTNNTITFVKNRERLLSSILEGDQHLYHYTYSEDRKGNSRLYGIDNITKSYLDRKVLKFEFDYFANETLTVYDFTQKQNGYIKEKKYHYYAKDKEHMYIVNTLTKYLENEKLTDVDSHIDIYHFHYYDKDKKRVALTKHGKQTYGFDEVGRVNFYGDQDGNVSVKYSQFNKIENSLVYLNDQSFTYTYLYTDDSNHYLKKVISPQEEIELSYNEQGLIKELKTKKYHLQFEYDKNKMTKRIILPKKGEIITHHDSQSGELTTIDTLSYDKNIKDITLTDDLTHAMQTLKDEVSKGGIKNYPEWLW
jgi:hypothetical protein